MAPRYAISEADARADRDALLALAQRNLPGMTAARWHKYADASPLGPPRVVVAREGEDAGVVGMASLIPLRLVVDGTVVDGAIAGDFAVDAAHRGFGPARGIQRAALAAVAGDGAIRFALGMPNVAAEPLLLRLGYADLGRFTRFVKPLRSRAFLRRLIRHDAVATAAGRVLDVALALVSPERYRRLPANLRVGRPSVFDARFERVWREAHVRHAVVPERSAELLNWKFELTAPEPRFAVLALVEGDDVVAYAVTETRDRVRHVLDLLWTGGGDVLDALLLALVRDARAAGDVGVAVLRLGDRDELARRLRASGFLRHGEEIGAIVYAPPPLADALRDPSRWYLLAGDADV